MAMGSFHTHSQKDVVRRFAIMSLAKPMKMRRRNTAAHGEPVNGPFGSQVGSSARPRIGQVASPESTAPIKFQSPIQKDRQRTGIACSDNSVVGVVGSISFPNQPFDTIEDAMRLPGRNLPRNVTGQMFPSPGRFERDPERLPGSWSTAPILGQPRGQQPKLARALSSCRSCRTAARSLRAIARSMLSARSVVATVNSNKEVINFTGWMVDAIRVGCPEWRWCRRAG